MISRTETHSLQPKPSAQKQHTQIKHNYPTDNFSSAQQAHTTQCTRLCGSSDSIRINLSCSHHDQVFRTFIDPPALQRDAHDSLFRSRARALYAPHRKSSFNRTSASNNTVCACMFSRASHYTPVLYKHPVSGEPWVINNEVFLLLTNNNNF